MVVNFVVVGALIIVIILIFIIIITFTKSITHH